jgi:hypothetical protein
VRAVCGCHPGLLDLDRLQCNTSDFAEFGLRQDASVEILRAKGALRMTAWLGGACLSESLKLRLESGSRLILDPAGMGSSMLDPYQEGSH